MTEKKKINVIKKFKKDDNHLKSGMKKDSSKREITHGLKLEWMRSCVMFGKTFAQTVIYFKSKGFNLAPTQNTELRNELKSSKQSVNWFSKEALYVIEDDHKLSVERIRWMEDTLINQYAILVDEKDPDIHLMDKLVARFESLQMTKTKMFSATPMVQEMMEVHRMQEEESNIVKEPTPQVLEKEIKRMN